MKKLFIILYLIYCTISCKEKVNRFENKCNEIKSIAQNEIKKGNIYLYSKHNYSELEWYFIFKKYRIIEYTDFYPISIDSCFIYEMNKYIEKNISPIRNIIKDLDSLENSNYFKFKNDEKQTFFDGIHEFPRTYKERREIQHPSFDELRDTLNKKIMLIDSTFSKNSFWLEINDNGEIENIEIYRSHSKKVDSLVVCELNKIKYEFLYPKILKNKSGFRKYYFINNTSKESND